MNGNATLRAAGEVKKQIAAAAAQKMGCGAEDLIFRGDRVSKENAGGGPFDSSLRQVRATQQQDQVTVAGRVEGQILRGSLQQKRKDEGPKDSMTFERRSWRRSTFMGR